MDFETQNYEGMPRRYGLEIEYAGVTLPVSAKIVSNAISGTVHQDHKTHYTVTSDLFGDFAVELDVELAQKISAKAKAQHDVNPDQISLEGLADMVLPDILQAIAPTEIVSSPLTAGQLHVVQDIVNALRDAGALGTRSSIFYAFGYHVNPEIKSRTTADIRNTLCSFIILYDWIATQLDMDLTRRISGYAAPYPKDYANHILNPAYDPDESTLIDDYMRFNPTRNFALDALPLFKFLDPDRVQAANPDSLIKARPTWHFRMPNCSISDLGWSIYPAIELWCAVERLSENPSALQKLMQEYSRRTPDIVSGIDIEWAAYTEKEAGIHHAA